jgi:hypothetical protein
MFDEIVDILPDLKDGDSSCETLMSERNKFLFVSGSVLNLKP